MKLVVTGGYGFIGSNFILKLLESNEDYKITNIDAELNGSNSKNLDSIKKVKFLGKSKKIAQTLIAEIEG